MTHIFIVRCRVYPFPPRHIMGMDIYSYNCSSNRMACEVKCKAFTHGIRATNGPSGSLGVTTYHKTQCITHTPVLARNETPLLPFRSALCWWLVGFALAYGADKWRFVGTDMFALSGRDDRPPGMKEAEWMFDWAFAGKVTRARMREFCCYTRFEYTMFFRRIFFFR